MNFRSPNNEAINSPSDGDQKAYYESSEITMNKNKDTIAKLRLSNKKLHQELAVAKGQAGDEEVILSAFNATSRNEVSLVRSGILSQVKIDFNRF